MLVKGCRRGRGSKIEHKAPNQREGHEALEWGNTMVAVRVVPV